jgi:hypothetical protein
LRAMVRRFSICHCGKCRRNKDNRGQRSEIRCQGSGNREQVATATRCGEGQGSGGS